MTRLFKTLHFTRWMEKTGLSDALLVNAVREMECGLIDADLGGGIVKKRIAVQGHGKRGSTRTLIATNKNDRWFFIFGFEKNERENINATELKFLKQFATKLLKTSNQELDISLKNNVLLEIHYEKD
ncbi:MAG: type II toxin-antitoxin system RelE/ParE family toxin [Methylococcaceae bacterium]